MFGKLLVLGLIGASLVLPVGAQEKKEPESRKLPAGRQGVKVKESLKTREAKRVEFKQKASQIRDQKKKVIVEKMDTRMEEVNKKRTAVMAKHLDKMVEVLGKIERRTDVTTAKTAVETAKTAVSKQAEKSYTIEIGDEAKLGQAVSAARKQLELDLRDVNKLVIEARKAVGTAIGAK